MDMLGIFHANQTSTSEIRVRMVPSNMLSPLLIFLLTVPRRCFFCGPFLQFVFRVCLCLFLAVLWPHAGKGLLALLCVMFFLMFLSFFIWCPGLGVVIDCIDF